jgi:GT2 family glycosyltransferase
LTASVVIITRNRPDMLRRCLEHLAGQGADEILVVDASDGSETLALLMDHPGVWYLDFRGQRNKMPASRNVGIASARGDIVAFLDDDSLARPGWLAAIRGAFTEGVGCVGGRAVDENEPTLPDATCVGRLLPDGTRIDNFNADPGRILEVDRVRGCNMAFRRDVLVALGGFDRQYTGSNVNEAGDMCLRVKAAGHKVLYEPAAVVDHVSAPREEIPRDPATRRTQYFLARNRTYLLLKTLGPTRAVLGTLFGRELAEAWGARRRNGAAWVLAHVGGKAVGLLVACLPRHTGMPKRRRSAGASSMTR